MMFCNDCGRLFDSPTENTYYESHDEVDSRNLEKITELSCPSCGSDYITDAVECMCCGMATEPFPGICEDCKEVITTGIKEIASKLDSTTEKVLDSIAMLADLEEI